MAKVVEGNTAKRSRRLPDDMRRWYTRTNFYVAEYIVMLALVAILLGILSSLWYTFFQSLVSGGLNGRSIAITAAASIGALIVVLPVTFLSYSRVIGQEAAEPSVIHSKVRNVFLTIWLVVATLAIVSVAISMISSVISVLFGVSDDVKNSLVEVFLPGLFIIPTLAFGVFMVGKHASRQLVMLSVLALGSIALILLVANSIMIFVRRDASRIDLPIDSACTYDRYANGDCSYDEYRTYLMSPSGDSYKYQ